MRNESLSFRTNILPFGRQKINAEHRAFKLEVANPIPEILFITSYPPRECGIATYSQDLMASLKQ